MCAVNHFSHQIHSLTESIWFCYTQDDLQSNVPTTKQDTYTQHWQAEFSLHPYVARLLITAFYFWQKSLANADKTLNTAMACHPTHSHGMQQDRTTKQEGWNSSRMRFGLMLLLLPHHTWSTPQERVTSKSPEVFKTTPQEPSLKENTRKRTLLSPSV